MPKIISFHCKEKIYLQINIVSNTWFDYDKTRDDVENWIPFNFLIKVWGKKLVFPRNINPTFTLFELRYLIEKIDLFVQNKESNYKSEDICFCCLENYFKLKITDIEEDNLVEIETWLPNSGKLLGKKHGYEEGYLFVSTIKSLKEFSVGIRSQLRSLFSIEI